MSTITHPPQRTHSQRMQAIQRANEVRVARAKLKAEVKTGTRSLLAVLERPPAYAESMKVYDLLTALPRVGQFKASSLLRRKAISQAKTVAGLTERQRRELAGMLEGRNEGGMRS